MDVSAGADFAFRRHSSALVLCGIQNDVAIVTKTIVRTPARGQPLRPSAVATEFVAATVGAGGGYLMADLYYRDAVLEYVTDAGLAWRDAPITPREIADSYLLVKVLMAEGRLKIPRDEELLVEQLRETRVVYKAGGHITPIHDDTEGAHGDVVAALVLACWAARGLLGGVDYTPAYGGGYTFAEHLRDAVTDGPADDPDWLRYAVGEDGMPEGDDGDLVWAR